MINVPDTHPSAVLASPAPEQRNAHVVDWLRHHQRAKLNAIEAAKTPITAPYPNDPAFHRHKLDQAVRTAREAHTRAKAAVLLAKGKMPKIEARRLKNIAAAILTRAEAALAREDSGERLATTVQRRDIVSHTGLVLREARVVIAAGKRVELQHALERLRARKQISARCYHAGRRYREAWETASRGLFPGGLNLGSGGGSDPTSGNVRVEESIGNGTQLAGARNAIGRFGTAMLDHVVIEGLSLASWAERQGESEFSGKGMLVTVLERLAEHWMTCDAALLPTAQVAQIRSLHGSR